jgi:5'-nucleotidase
MSKFNELTKNIGRNWRAPVKSTMVVALAASLGGCFLPAANRDAARDGSIPWWCKGSPDLTIAQCASFSWNLDIATAVAGNYTTLANLTGATEVVNRPDDIGVAFTNVATPTVFDPNIPNVFLYDGNSPTSRLVGVAWEISSASAPAGFEGDRDVWTQNPTTGNWWLTAWTTRGYENHPNVFAASHPCLTSSGSTLTSTNDACFTASHTEPFEVVVTNDDGYSAGGIDALVEGLYGIPNIVVHVVAPLANQSGSGDTVTRPGYTVSASSVLTPGGKPATAIASTDPQRPNGSGSPADTVLYAFNVLQLSPEMVLSGINQGQNMGSIVGLSGTVGAARTARRNGVPAIATSQGFSQGSGEDFPTGTTATLALLEEWRLGRTVHTNASVLNINIPTCVSGYTVRGTVQTVVATNANNYTLQDCSSTAPANSVISDVDAFNKGFIGIADVGQIKPPNWP